MADLTDGASVEMKGSGARPYILKNVGGVYSCTCPAWRNQSVAIERRTCKHLRKLRGDAAEDARIGRDSPPSVDAEDEEGAEEKTGPPLLLAERWDNAQDLAGWWLSEKLDGVRAYWDGKALISRLGNRFHAPDWFLEGLPDTPLDGELWVGRKSFQRAVAIVRRQDKSDLWKEVRYLAFDAPGVDAPFEHRLAALRAHIERCRPPYLSAHEHTICTSLDHLRAELARVEALGGEGLMLRQPESRYEVGRSLTLLKIKSFRDAEARVLEHLKGAGRHKGRLGALLVELADGTRFSVGTGFSDAERAAPPSVGSVITFRYQELSDGGVPRFPSYVGVRADAAVPGGPPVVASHPSPPGAARRFEFVEGSSRKFWEVCQDGRKVSVRYGRIGSNGQSSTKELASVETAQRYAQGLIEEKLAKGYCDRSGA
ncbi:MAG: DNA ligase [Isosphaeraceae bacterium]|nr:DNA ligase [Isosphaeraceae bacterium]